VAFGAAFVRRRLWLPGSGRSVGQSKKYGSIPHLGKTSCNGSAAHRIACLILVRFMALCKAQCISVGHVLPTAPRPHLKPRVDMERVLPGRLNAQQVEHALSPTPSR
jgi:hypothetical protein